MFISLHYKICYLASSLIKKALIKMRKSFGSLFEKAYFLFASLLISSVIFFQKPLNGQGIEEARKSCFVALK